METVFFTRVNTGFNVGNILPDRSAHVARFGEEIFGKFRDVSAGDTEGKSFLFSIELIKKYIKYDT